MAKTDKDLPAWTELAGGRPLWKKWLERRVQGCLTRAKKWATKQKGKHALPTRAGWRAAIIDAMTRCGGIAEYSGLSLSVQSPIRETDWNWPSVDHLKDAGTAEVAIETRLVNDMKTIMSEKEFREMVGHLAEVFRITVQRLPTNWKCERSFAVKQKAEEPPIAVKK